TAGRLYEAILGRVPDASGMAFWAGLTKDNASLLQTANSMLEGNEFTAAHGPVSQLSNASFIEIAYRTAIDRAPDAAGLQFWLNQLANGVSKGEVMIGIALATETTGLSDIDVTINKSII
ncbi:MAG: DUF4214 domain-containing protein, partial [Bosea sp. (in: a-proteobacteria)]